MVTTFELPIQERHAMAAEPLGWPGAGALVL